MTLPNSHLMNTVCKRIYFRTTPKGHIIVKNNCTKIICSSDHLGVSRTSYTSPGVPICFAALDFLEKSGGNCKRKNCTFFHSPQLVSTVKTRGLYQIAKDCFIKENPPKKEESSLKVEPKIEPKVEDIPLVKKEEFVPPKNENVRILSVPTDILKLVYYWVRGEERSAAFKHMSLICTRFRDMLAAMREKEMKFFSIVNPSVVSLSLELYELRISDGFEFAPSSQKYSFMDISQKFKILPGMLETLKGHVHGTITLNNTTTEKMEDNEEIIVKCEHGTVTHFHKKSGSTEYEFDERTRMIKGNTGAYKFTCVCVKPGIYNVMITDTFFSKCVGTYSELNIKTNEFRSLELHSSTTEACLINDLRSGFYMLRDDKGIMRTSRTFTSDRKKGSLVTRFEDGKVDMDYEMVVRGRSTERHLRMYNPNGTIGMEVFEIFLILFHHTIYCKNNVHILCLYMII